MQTNNRKHENFSTAKTYREMLLAKSVKPKHHKERCERWHLELFWDLPWHRATPSSTVHEAAPQGLGSHGLKAPRKERCISLPSFI